MRLQNKNVNCCLPHCSTQDCSCSVLALQIKVFQLRTISPYERVTHHVTPRVSSPRPIDT